MSVSVNSNKNGKKNTTRKIDENLFGLHIHTEVKFVWNKLQNIIFLSKCRVKCIVNDGGGIERVTQRIYFIFFNTLPTYGAARDIVYEDDDDTHTMYGNNIIP